MGVHRYENLICKKIFCMVLSVVVHRKKFIHMKRAGGYRIGFLQFLSYEKSRWLLNYKITYNFQSMSGMQSEKDYFYHHNVFVQNHDFEKVF